MKLSALALVATLISGSALAQSIPVPLVIPNASDLTPIIPGGAPQAQSKYASVGASSGTLAYANLGTLVTTNTYAFANGVTNAFGNAAGTLAAIGLTTEPNPGDGKRECFILNQTVTTLTWTANTGQTIDSHVPSATVAANVPHCITYVASSATWFGSN